MELGISTYTFPWAFGVKGFALPQRMTVFDLMLFATKHNIRYVQIGDNYPLHQLPDTELTRVGNEAKAMGIHLQVGTRRLSVDNTLLYLSICTKLASPFLRMVIDDGSFKPTGTAVIKTINRILPAFKEAGVMLAIENHDRFPAQTLKAIVEATDPDTVGICLDTTNSIGAGQGIHEILPFLLKYTVNVHIKDFIIERLSHRMGFRVYGCAAGEGMLAIPSLIEDISTYGRCKTATLELWLQPEKTMEATLRKEASRVEKSIDYLKTVIT